MTSLKTDVNVPIVSTIISKKTHILLVSGKPLAGKSGSGSGAGSEIRCTDPDLSKNVTDPEHWSK